VLHSTLSFFKLSEPSSQWLVRCCLFSIWTTKIILHGHNWLELTISQQALSSLQNGCHLTDWMTGAKHIIWIPQHNSVSIMTATLVLLKTSKDKIQSFYIFQYEHHDHTTQINQYIILSHAGCLMRQITSCRIEYSRFIPHSLLHSHNLQSYNYCHRQYHNYLSCSHCHSLDTAQLVAAGLHWTQWFHDPHSVATNHTIGIHVTDSLATTALGDFLIHTLT
jgi:hypothetical protein